MAGDQKLQCTDSCRRFVCELQPPDSFEKPRELPGCSYILCRPPIHPTPPTAVTVCLCLVGWSQDGRNWARIEAEHHTHALFDVGAAGEWDSTFIGHPQVVAAGARDMRMYYHSFDAAAGKFKVGLATSRDGFTWKKEGVVFEGSSNKQDFDGAGAAACFVVSGWWWW